MLQACRKSRNRELVAVVIVAMETGLRRGELLGLTWDRVDLSRGVLRLEVTKSGRRREVPMRQAVYDVLAARPEPRDGRVFRTRSIRTALENAVEEAKLDDLHFHDLLQSLREPVRHAGWVAVGSPEDSGARGSEDDAAVRAPRAALPAGRDRQDRAAGSGRRENHARSHMSRSLRSLLRRLLSNSSL